MKTIIAIILLSVNLFAQGFINSKGNLYPSFYQGKDTTAKFGIGIPPGDPLLYTLSLRDSATIGTETFINGFMGTGVAMQYDSSEYTFIIDNLLVRGTLAVYELIINQIRATNGNLLVTAAARVDTARRFTGGTPHYFICEDVTGHGLSPFAQNDIIMCQVVNINGATHDGSGDFVNNQYLVKRLVYKIDSIAYNNNLKIYYSDLSGAPTNKSYPKKGDTFVRLGNTSNTARQGLIMLASDEPNSPYITIKNGINSWANWKSATTLKVQIGNLESIRSAFATQFPDMPEDEYGFFAKGGIYLLNGKIVLADSGYIRGGQTAYNTGEGFFIGNDSGTPKLSIGDPAGNHLIWDGSELAINGEFFASDTTLVKSVDSLRSRVSTAEASISTHSGQISGLQGDVSGLYATVALKANITTTDSLRSRITSAEGSIVINASDIDGLESTVALKANVTTTDSLRSRITSAEAGIVINASDIDGLTSNLLLYARKDSIISKINLSPEGIDISGSRITLDGNVTVDGSFQLNGSALINGTVTADAVDASISITSPTITGGTFQTAASGARIKIFNNEITIYNSDGGSMVIQPYADYSGYAISQIVSGGFRLYDGVNTSYIVPDRIVVDGYVQVDDEVYGSGWNNSLQVPTKNAVYDKINSLSYSDVGAAASSHTHTYTSITGQTVTFNGILEAASGNEYTLVFQNGILTSYSLYP